MLALLTISLEAHNSERNHHRRYEITVGRDLLGDWMVTIRYGRTGQGGQECHYGSSDPAAMQAVVRDHLHRRLAAPRRIGCAYTLTGFQITNGLCSCSWVPSALLKQFSGSGEGQMRVMPVSPHYPLDASKPRSVECGHEAVETTVIRPDRRAAIGAEQASAGHGENGCRSPGSPAIARPREESHQATL